MTYAYDTFDAWLRGHGFADSLDATGELRDGTAQGFFASQYTAWLTDLLAFHAQALRARYDLPPDQQFSITLNQNDPTGLPIVSGLTAAQTAGLFGDTSDFAWGGKHVRYYANSFLLPPGHAPVADNVAAGGSEDAPSVALTLTASDADAGDAIESFTLTSLPPSGAGILYTDAALSNAAAAGVAYAASGGMLTLYFVPHENFNGAVNVNYTASDGELSSAAATATVTLTQQNDPAIFGGDLGGSGQEDGGPIPGTLTVSDEADGMTAPSFRIEIGDGPGNGAASIDPVTGHWSYIPNADFNGIDHFIVSVTDDDGNVETRVIDIAVNPAVDPTVARDDEFSVSEDSGGAGNVLANDSNPDNQPVVALSGVRDANSLPRIVITEIMFNPAVVSDADGEWFEVYNAGAAPVDLNGWTIRIGGNSIVVDSPTPLLIGPGDFFVFAANSFFVSSASASYETGPLGLANDGTTIALLDPDSHEIDRVEYLPANVLADPPGTFPADAEGRSFYLRDAGADNSDGLLWETTPDNLGFFYGVPGNAGTPGGANPIFAGATGLGDPPVVGQPAVFLSGALLTLNADGTFVFDTNHSYDFLAEGQSFIEQFTYTLSGGQSANVVLTIEGANDAPVAHDDVYAALEDVPFIAELPNAQSVLGNDRDVDFAAALTASLVAPPGHGSLTLNADGTFIYTPDPEFSGTDHFTYRVNDGFVDSNEATVEIQVVALNDAPVAHDDVATTDAHTAISGNVLGNDNDIDGDALSVLAVAGLSPADVLPNIIISEIMDNPAGVPDLTGEWFEVFNAGALPADLNGWTIKIGDNTIVVDNHAPLLIPAGGYLVFAASDDPVANPGIFGNGVGYVTGPLGLVDAGIAITLFDAAGHEIDRVDTHAILLPPEGHSSFLINASLDNSLGTSWETSGGPPYNSPNYGTPGQGALVRSDPVAAIGEQVTLASGALLTLNADGSFDYDPNGSFDFLAAGATTTDGFAYMASDGNGGIDTAVVTITIQGPSGGNHAPVAVNDFAQLTVEDEVAGIGELGLLANDFDPDGDDLELVAINGNRDNVGGSYVVLPSGALLQSFSDGGYNYLPLADSFFHLALGESYVDRITYTIRDTTGLTSDGTLEVTINGILPGPLAVDDSGATDEDTLLFGGLGASNLLANDSDFDGPGVLTVAAVNGSEAAVDHQIVLASGALLTVSSDGTYIYNPNGRFDHLQSGESATDSFDYAAANAQGVWATATATITISGLDDEPPEPPDPPGPPDPHAPVAVADFGVVFVDSEINAFPPEQFGLLLNDHDPDGDGIELVAVNGDASLVDTGEFIALPSGALLQIFSDGAYDYVAVFDASPGLAPGASLIDRINYTIRDTTGLTSDGTLDVTVIAPEAVLESPATSTIASGQTLQVYGSIDAAELTAPPGASANIVAQLGYGALGTNPKTSWTWIDASFSAQLPTGDEYVASIPDDLLPGEYGYAYRFGLSTDGQAPVSWAYADLDGSANGFHPSQLGSLFVI
jgi:VCBS repeat-containing protein